MILTESPPPQLEHRALVDTIFVSLFCSASWDGLEAIGMLLE